MIEELMYWMFIEEGSEEGCFSDYRSDEEVEEEK